MLDTACVFVTDGGYLAPSLLAAKQLLRQGISDLADILIYTIDVDEAVTDRLAREIGHRLLGFVPLHSRAFVPPDGTSFHRNHVPVAALARLTLEPEIPQQYRNIIYLDGDIQVVGDISPLVQYRVPDGKILAGRGSAWLDPHDEYAMQPPGYLDALGGVAPDDYFNSGVLAFNRDTWSSQGPLALELFVRNADTFFRHDQSALNSAFRESVHYFSPAYNFHAIYASAYAAKIVQPKIIHFTGQWKPWKRASPHWGPRFYRSYVDLLSQHRGLHDFFEVAPLHIWALRQPKDWFDEARRLARERTVLRERQALIADYLATGDFAVR